MSGIPGQFLTRTEDAQLLTVLSVLWAFLTYMPFALLLIHKFGHYGRKSGGYVGSWRRKIEETMNNYTWIWIAAGAIMYTALLAANIFYWWTGAPHRTNHTISFDLYAATLFVIIGMMFTEAFKIAVMYHGSNPAPLMILIVLHFLEAVAVASLVGFSLFKFDTKPAGLAFAWAVYLLYAICVAFTTILGIYYYFQNASWAMTESAEKPAKAGSSTASEGYSSAAETEVTALATVRSGAAKAARGDADKGSSRRRKEKGTKN